ncbi:multidrug transporter AcrB [Planctomycetales bacterium]|nr:multidrug transporter AcrB [Planctomycetales bacterium]
MLPKYALENRTLVGTAVTLLAIGGVWAYLSMGRLEDPEFTVRTGYVVTAYPGASAEEVDQQVTQVVERYIRRVSGVKQVRCISRVGVSIIYVDMQPDFPPEKLPIAWQELRNKLSGAKQELPLESLPPQVHDDFGDVYGIIFALTGDGYSATDLQNYAEILQRELQILPEAGRVELRGVRKEAIEINISRSRMSALSVPMELLILALNQQNLQIDTGQITLDGQNIRVASKGTFESPDEIGNLIIPNGLTNLDDALRTYRPPALTLKEPVRLRDFATIRRTLIDPPPEIVRSNGKDAVAVCISPIKGGNVIRMGEEVEKRIREMMQMFPVGLKLDRVCYQPDNVTKAVRLFEKNLLEAVVIVTVTVMIAMGLRSGLLITGSLLVVIFGTLCVLHPLGVVLNRTSLGAFIIALGILVDDAVVVGDMILVNMQRGKSRRDACVDGANQVGIQLLGATIVGALAFLPVYLSPDDTGEYCRDLFIVVAVSLMISWFVAMTQTPVVYYQFVRIKGVKGTGCANSHCDPHGGFIYRLYRRLLESTLRYRWIAFAVLLTILIAAGYGFTKIEKIFFPPALRTQFLVRYWRAEGTSIHSVADDLAEIEKYVLRQNGVVQTSAFIGGGPPRFYLPYSPELPKSCYGMLIVNVQNIGDVDKLIIPLEKHLKEAYPQGLLRVQRFMLGPMTKNDIEVRFKGSDPAVLRQLAQRSQKIFASKNIAKDVSDDWKENVLVWQPVFSQVKENFAFLGRSDVNTALRWWTRGITSGFYHEDDHLIPIQVRVSLPERNDFANLTSMPVKGMFGQNVPLGQIIESSELVWQPSQICRRDGVLTITASCNPIDRIQWRELFNTVRGEVEAIPLPDGYSLEWGGQREKSLDAERMLGQYLPVTFVLMALIVVALFNSLRQPLIVLLTFPLILIGITFGLLVTNLPFGFMALVGAMSLLGMCIRNAVVLMSQIDIELKKDCSPCEAVVNASVERLRPVSVAAMTVVVGMIPLLRDPLFNSMAAAMMFGLIFATAITLLLVPVLYTVLFGIRCR